MEKDKDKDKENNKNPHNLIAHFDHSVNNFFSYMDLVTSLCHLPTKESFQQSEIDRYTSMITFLKEWKSLFYESKAVQFTYEIDSGRLEDGFSQISLPQFSSAAVPKIKQPEEESKTMDRNDYIFNAGGLVWAFDWCPRDSEMHDSSIQCEYLAVASHLPGTGTHNIGLPLYGRGIIQIWSLLTARENIDQEVVAKECRGRPRKPTHVSEVKEVIKKPRGRPRKQPLDSEGEEAIKKPRGRPTKQNTDLKRPRGRPRKETKTTLDESVTSNIDSGEVIPKEDSVLSTSKAISVFNEDAELLSSLRRRLSSKGGRGRLKRGSTSRKTTKGSGNNTDNCTPLPDFEPIVEGPGILTENAESSVVPNAEEEALSKTFLAFSLPTDCEGVLKSCGGKSVMKPRKVVKSRVRKTCGSFEESLSTLPSQEEPSNVSEEVTEGIPSISKETPLPKLVMCIGHMGKVAWDLKWRPSNVNELEEKQCLGYLAILLGNGSLEVWEIPCPSMVGILYTSCGKDGTDPRFFRLKPVFRCAKVKYGDNQSIPLTVEWSTAAPHDLLLAGCHDGTVALWRFSKQHLAQDVKPLLCFSADSAPIRALAWAPDERDAENANLIVTAGHEGLKLWDLRDPYRPLWDTDPVQKVILSFDWLKEPRCFLCSCDDGKVRVISLSNMVDEVRFTGESSSCMKAKTSSLFCSNFAVWSIQVSRSTGVASYCTADGSACCFQLTYKAVEKDSGRYREPHYLCGSFAKEDEVVKINTPLSNGSFQRTPLTVQHNVNEFGAASRALGSTGTSKSKSSVNTLSVLTSETKKHGKKRNREREPSFMQLVEVAAAKDADEKNESDRNILEVPDKDVALHRVRWNMNKGSERWLCYGGAAGIVRCQAISLSSKQ